MQPSRSARHNHVSPVTTAVKTAADRSLPASRKVPSVTVGTKKRVQRRAAPVRNPLHGPSWNDTAHNVACALAYLNTAELRGYPSEEVSFGRFLLAETVIHALETARHES